MASLIIIAIILVVAGILVGGFIAISLAISRGHRVRSVIWKVPGRVGGESRRLTRL
jgi:hypothetical protein